MLNVSVQNVEKCIVSKECTFKLPTDYSFKVVTEHRFQLSFGGETVTKSIEARQFKKLPSEIIFAQCVFKKCAYRRLPMILCASTIVWHT